MTIPDPVATRPAIPDHELISKIGSGSYGEVWLARNIIGNYRAVKIVYRKTFENDRPFEREFKGIQKFEPISRSDNSQVNILHVGRNPDCFYYVMELADDQTRGQQIDPDTYAAKTLSSELAQHGRLPFAECLEIGLALTAALAHLHKNGLVHRDVKPSNVIFVNGIPKLADIGLVTDSAATMSFVGTEGFLPPEGPGTPRADIYSLGKVLYEISTGKDRKAYPEPPTLLGEFADREEYLELSAIIARACESNVHKRYGTAKAMQADLLLLKTGKSVRQTHRLQRRLAAATKASIIVIAMSLLTLGLFWLAQSVTEHARQQIVLKPSTSPVIGSSLTFSPGNRPIAKEPPGPLVFDNSLTWADTLDKFYYSSGQYGSRAEIVPRTGMRFLDGHTEAVVWAKPFLGDRYRVEFEVQMSGSEWAGWVMNGPGYGNSPDTGYAWRLDKDSLILFREGRQITERWYLPRNKPKDWSSGQWIRVQADVNGTNIAVRINDIPMSQFSDSVFLTGPLHGWLGLSGEKAVFRNLRIWSAALNNNQARQLTPPITEKPLPNGNLIYEFKPAGKLGEEWWQSQPEHVQIETSALVLEGKDNGSPAIVLAKPLPYNVACEIEFEYPTFEAINFRVMLSFANKPPQSLEDCDAGWVIYLPQNGGWHDMDVNDGVALCWHRGPTDAGSAWETDGPFMDSTPYYMSVAQRKYRARIETSGNGIRVFLDGGLVLNAKRPNESLAPTAPLFLVMGQRYSSTKIYAVRIYELAGKTSGGGN